MTSDTRAYIDHSALQYNLSIVRKLCPGCQVAAVVKADAYGFGIENVILPLKQADAFAVATVSEAVRLRDCGVEQPVFVLHGARDSDELDLAIELRLVLTVHNEQQLSLLMSHSNAKHYGRMLSVWLKINSGMNRLGCAPKETLRIWQQLQSMDWIKTLGILTHLACSDMPMHPLNEAQMTTFNEALNNIQEDRSQSCDISIANSAAILNLKSSRTGWVRPGIMLYGGSSTREKLRAEYESRPVMRLCSRIIAIQSVVTGESIGYGATFLATRDMTVAVVAVGYGDGYPRHIAANQVVSIHGRHCPIVGRISMDMMTVDVTDLPIDQPAMMGDEVELWGPHVSVDQLARGAGTTSYELFCQLTPRVERVVERLVEKVVVQSEEG